MRMLTLKRNLVAATTFAAMTGGMTHAAERSDIPEKYTWDLTHLYKTEAAWQEAKDAFAEKIPSIAVYKGTLATSAETLHKALSLSFDMSKEYERLYSYASMLSDQDKRVAKHQERLQGLQQLGVKFNSAQAFIAPEILTADPAKIKGFVTQYKPLFPYAFYLDNVLRARAHTLSPQEEIIVAEAGNFAGSGEDIYSTFTNADLPYPTVKLSDGKTVRLDASAYTNYRGAKNRADRQKVFVAFWTEYGKFTRTLGNTLYAQVKSHLFEMKVRNFKSSLESSLFEDNIPKEVYHELIANVRNSLPTLHRYLALRQRMMGLKDLRYDDLYAPLVASAKKTYTPEQAMDMTLEAFAPLGSDYVQALKKGYAERWTDFLPSTGKRSGAYSNGSAYDVHPYQLLNFMGNYDDVSTLAHESGHSMHSYLANKTQPYATHDYSIFVAEVASTLNENLLLDNALKKAENDDERLSLLGSFLEGLRTTLYRQTLFAEFELRIHEMAEKNESLTGENLTDSYLKLVRDYYGHDKGICVVDALYGNEWAYIPHFYYNFYVYKYATSLIASLSIAKKIREELAQTPPVTKTRDAYLAMLTAGGSRYPMELLKSVGVDMTTTEPFAAAMGEMNRIMDEMEAILAKKTSKKKS